MANRNFANKGSIYTMHAMPVLLDGNFVVDSTNGNGLGIRNLKGPMIQNVFMHTSAAFTGTSHTSNSITGIASGTAALAVGMPIQGSGIPANTTIASIVDSGSITLSAATSSSITASFTYQGLGNKNTATPGILVPNPNPAVGTIIVQLQDNYNKSFSGFNSIVSPVSGSPLLVASAGLTVGVAYIIVALGTTTNAQWRALGVPKGITPAVGGSFIAAATSAPGTGAVEITSSLGSGVCMIETVGDPNASIAPDPRFSPGFGAQLILQCRDYQGALVAPVDGSVISLAMYLSNSSVTVQGE